MATKKASLERIEKPTDKPTETRFVDQRFVDLIVPEMGELATDIGGCTVAWSCSQAEYEAAWRRAADKHRSIYGTSLPPKQ